MNLNALNSVVVNGSRSTVIISGDAAVTAEALVTADASFIESGSVAVNSSALLSADPLHLHGAVATLVGSAGVLATTETLSTASSAIVATATVTAVLLRSVPTSIEFTGSAAVSAVVADEVGASALDGTASVAAIGTIITPTTVAISAGATVTLADLGSVVAIRKSPVDISCSALVRAEVTYNRLPDGFAFVQGKGRAVTSQSGVTHFCSGVAAPTVSAQVSANAQQIQHAQGAVVVSASVAVFAFNTGDAEVDGPLTCVASVTANPVRNLFGSVEVTGTADARVAVNEPNQIFACNASISASANVSAYLFHIFKARASVLAAASVEPSPARLALPNADISASGRAFVSESATTRIVTSDIDITPDVTITATLTYTHKTATVEYGASALVAALGSYIKFGNASFSVSASVAPTGTRGVSAYGEVEAEASISSVAIRVVKPSCDVAALGEVAPVPTHIKAATADTMQGSGAVFAFPSTNSAALNKPAFTFVRPPYLSYFARPPYTSVLSRTSSPTTFRRAA